GTPEVPRIPGSEIEAGNERGQRHADTTLVAAPAAARGPEIEIGLERADTSRGVAHRIEHDRSRPPRLSRPAGPEQGPCRRGHVERDRDAVTPAHGRAVP